MLIIDTYRDLMEQERLTEQEKVVIEQWKPVLDELDRTENCNNRRHKEKRDMLDMTLCECQNEKEEYLSSEIKLKLSDTDENWLEWVFRERYCRTVGEQRAEYPKTAGTGKGTYENIVLERRQKP